MLVAITTQSNTIEVSISKSLIDSYINHDEFVSANNVLERIYCLREYNEINEDIINPENAMKYTI